MKKILVLNGPNLNMLGIREPDIYGSKKLEDINRELKELGDKFEFELEFYQSNYEGDIIEKIHINYDKIDYLIINPGALTHYSIALRDAIMATGIKSIEVHISNVYSREKFRANSVISDISIGKITGFGYIGYKMALLYIYELEKKEGELHCSDEI